MGESLDLSREVGWAHPGSIHHPVG